MEFENAKENASDTGNNVTGKRVTANSKSYTLARLERDYPRTVFPPCTKWSELKGAYGLKKSAREEVETAPVNMNRTDGPKPANCDNITVRTNTEGGTSATYLAARIKRDHPDIHRRMLIQQFALPYAANSLRISFS